jgi:bacillithiol biosynthesis deacetylase BshB1
LVDVVCIGAHPDDVEIGMGGSVAAMVRQGLSVALVDLTNGEPTPHGTPETRAAEAKRAAEILCVHERRTLSQPNRSLMDTVDARLELAQALRELRPQILFVPYPLDAHPDHVAAHQIATAARFYAKLTKTEMSGEPHYPRRVYQYMAVHMRLVALPAFILDISETIDVKLEALAAYRSQFGDNEANSGIIPMMELTARSWGMQIGVSAGEPFYTPEPVGLRSLADLI